MQTHCSLPCTMKHRNLRSTVPASPSSLPSSDPVPCDPLPFDPYADPKPQELYTTLRHHCCEFCIVLVVAVSTSGAERNCVFPRMSRRLVAARTRQFFLARCSHRHNLSRSRCHQKCSAPRRTPSVRLCHCIPIPVFLVARDDLRYCEFFQRVKRSDSSLVWLGLCAPTGISRSSANRIFTSVSCSSPPLVICATDDGSSPRTTVYTHSSTHFCYTYI